MATGSGGDESRQAGLNGSMPCRFSKKRATRRWSTPFTFVQNHRNIRQGTLKRMPAKFPCSWTREGRCDSTAFCSPDVAGSPIIAGADFGTQISQGSKKPSGATKPFAREARGMPWAVLNCDFSRRAATLSTKAPGESIPWLSALEGIARVGTRNISGFFHQTVEATSRERGSFTSEATIIQPQFVLSRRRKARL